MKYDLSNTRPGPELDYKLLTFDSHSLEAVVILKLRYSACRGRVVLKLKITIIFPTSAYYDTIYLFLGH